MSTYRSSAADRLSFGVLALGPAQPLSPHTAHAARAPPSRSPLAALANPHPHPPLPIPSAAASRHPWKVGGGRVEGAVPPAVRQPPQPVLPRLLRRRIMGHLPDNLLNHDHRRAARAHDSSQRSAGLACRVEGASRMLLLLLLRHKGRCGGRVTGR